MAKATKQTAAKSRKPKRAIGRPSDPAHVVGRDALIAATCELLKTMPPSEVSGVKIARLCGADPSLIRYYFRDRLGLLTAAAEKLTTEFNPDLAVLAAGANFEHQFRARLGRLLELDSANPFFHRLMLEELLGAHQKPARDLLDNLTKRGVAAYRAILDHRGPGVKPAEVNVDMLFVAIVGICQSFHTSHTLYELALGRKIGRAEFLAQYKVFVGDLLLNGVAQRPPE